MLFLSLLACSTEAPPPEEPVQSKVEQPSADVVLQRHIDLTHQCELMSQDNYTLGWEMLTTNNRMVAQAEKVVQHGRQGKSFTRVHERVRPNWGFTAVGMEPDGNFWSATADGVVAKIVDDKITKQMMQNLDPTPVCAYQARWKDRVNLGADDYEGTEAWHLMLTWHDGTVTEAWFDKKDGVLLGMLTASEGVEIRKGYTNYEEREGVIWPTQEKMQTKQDGERLIVMSRLEKLHVGREGLVDIGPQQIQKLLAKKVQDGVLDGPKDTTTPKSTKGPESTKGPASTSTTGGKGPTKK